MSSLSRQPGLEEAASHFLVDLSPEDRGPNQQEIHRFVRWFGRERPLASLTAAEVANYAQRLSTSDADYARKLERLRAFLVYARKEGWSQTNLAAHLKVKKEPVKLRSSSRRRSPATVFLTRQGYAEMEAEMVVLLGKRSAAITEIQKAAADKDFRENAPLQAAREQRGLLEGRIKEVEETLKSAVVIDEKPEATLTIGIGDSVLLCDLDSGAEWRCTLVGASEVDPAKGRISTASPLGQAIVGRGREEIVEVTAPAGKRRYQVKQIEC